MSPNATHPCHIIRLSFTSSHSLPLYPLLLRITPSFRDSTPILVKVRMLCRITSTACLIILHSAKMLQASSHDPPPPLSKKTPLLVKKTASVFARPHSIVTRIHLRRMYATNDVSKALKQLYYLQIFASLKVRERESESSKHERVRLVSRLKEMFGVALFVTSLHFPSH